MYASKNQLKPKVEKLQVFITDAYLYFLLSFYLLLVTSEGYQGIGNGKYQCFLWIHLAFLLILTMIDLEFLLMGEKKLEFHPRQFIKKDLWKNPSFYILLYLCFTVVSACFSEFPTVFWGLDRKEGLFTLVIYGLSYFYLQKFAVFSMKHLACFGCSMTVFCLIGFVQLCGYNPFSLYPAPYHFYDGGVHYSGQYWSTIGNTNLCVALLSMAVGVFAMALIRLDQKKINLLFCPLFLCVLAVLELKVEAGFVALLVGLPLMLPVALGNRRTIQRGFSVYGWIFLAVGASQLLVFSDKGLTLDCSFGVFFAVVGFILLQLLSRQKWTVFDAVAPRKIRNMLSVAVVALGLLFLLGLYTSPQLPEGYLQQAQEILHGNVEEEFGSSRIYIWKEVLERIPAHFWFGSGPDTLMMLEIEDFSRYDETLGQMIVEAIDVAHNEYLNIFIHQGVFALVTYLLAMGFSLFLWWNDQENSARAMAGAGVCFYLMQAFFGISMYLTAPYFWLLLAILNQNHPTELPSTTNSRRTKK